MICFVNSYINEQQSRRVPTAGVHVEKCYEQVFDSSAVPVPVNEWSSNLQPDSGHTRGQLSRLVHALITVTTRANVLSLLRCSNWVISADVLCMICYKCWKIVLI